MIGSIDGSNNEYVAGWIVDPENPTRRVQLDVFYNGAKLIRATAAFPRPELAGKDIGDGRNGFYIALPALSRPETAEIVILEAESQTPLGAPIKMRRHPTLWDGHLKAKDILGLTSNPVFSVDWFSMEGSELKISGCHLPPGGDPFSLQVTGQPGVQFTVNYPFNRPDVGDWFWYWPNPTWSGFQITIDLAASTAVGPDFQFTFDWPGALPERQELGLNRIWMPKDVGVLQNFPRGNQLTRVHNFENNSRVAIVGYSDFQRLRMLCEHFGCNLTKAAVLDWGCGHGRIIRNFHQQKLAREAWAIDIDAENVSWLDQNLPGIKASVVPLVPPTELPKKHFDLIYAISVMTHLRRAMQKAWLEELRRIAKRGALIILTFDGPGAVAFTSRYLQKGWLKQWKVNQFDDNEINKDLEGKIDDPSYYTNTKQTAQTVREIWGEYFEILGIYETAFGYQDVAVMRAR